MADGIQIEGDLSIALRSLEQEFPKYAKAALYAGAAVIKNNTKSNLTQRVPNATIQNPNYTDTLVDAIRNTKSDGDYVDVHILGVRSAGSGTYRTRFFENGTQGRYARTFRGKRLKKERYLGRIKPKYFFRDAVNSSETQAVQAMEQIINKFFDRFK